jgi:hypothetical protein
VKKQVNELIIKSPLDLLMKLECQNVDSPFRLKCNRKKESKIKRCLLREEYNEEVLI